MAVIKFSDKKQEILDALNKRHSSKAVPVSLYQIPPPTIICSSCGHSQLTLIDGFINQPLSSELSGSFVI